MINKYKDQKFITRYLFEKFIKTGDLKYIQNTTCVDSWDELYSFCDFIHIVHDEEIINEIIKYSNKTDVLNAYIINKKDSLIKKVLKYNPEINSQTVTNLVNTNNVKLARLIKILYPHINFNICNNTYFPLISYLIIHEQIEMLSLVLNSYNDFSIKDYHGNDSFYYYKNTQNKQITKLIKKYFLENED
jgi:hypothetical protein